MKRSMTLLALLSCLGMTSAWAFDDEAAAPAAEIQTDALAPAPGGWGHGGGPGGPHQGPVPHPYPGPHNPGPAPVPHPYPGPHGGGPYPYPHPYPQPYPYPHPYPVPHPYPYPVPYPAPYPIYGGGYPWPHWDHPPYPRPVYGWDWPRVRLVTCTAEDSYGDLYPVTENDYYGYEFEDRLPEIEDAAIDRCYDETGGDVSCRLLDCTAEY